jgi:acyl-CoA synthetase (AMP-forming)/AMP-acid ligase II
LTGGELVVTGRLKDLLIVRGHKHFPQDLERTAELCHPLIRPGSAAACPATPDDAGDRIVLVAEVETRPDHSPEDLSNIIDAIRLAIVEQHGLQLAGVALVPPRSVPRTTSGKLRRFACLPCLGSGAVRATATWGGVPAGDVGREGDAA